MRNPLAFTVKVEGGLKREIANFGNFSDANRNFRSKLHLVSQGYTVTLLARLRSTSQPRSL